MGIEWKDGAVCFAGDYQRSFIDGAWWRLMVGRWVPFSDGCAVKEPIEFKDFQLNTIKQGDYIEASELDTEGKYNLAVEGFGLFGFVFNGGAADEYRSFNDAESLICCDDGLWQTNTDRCNKRKITFNQLMAIGKLKRLEIERDKREAKECFVEALDEAVTHSEKLENEWTDKHYDFNYQLTQEDIEKGHVRIDAYFVNRMWKINQWDDTGAAFHVLKTLPRIANNKNPLKRELVALKKQVDLLCKMHGVDDGDLK